MVPVRRLMGGSKMSRKQLGCATAMSLVLVGAGCEGLLLLLPPIDAASVKLVLINDSATKYVSPNPGLCPQGLDTGPHSYLASRPLLAPGARVTITTFQLAGFDGLCVDADPSFMIGLCGWHHGDDPANLTQCSNQYGGQIGYQFHCGDTVILRWTDEGGPDGTWTSEVVSATGTAPPMMAFQLMPGGGQCEE